MPGSSPRGDIARLCLERLPPGEAACLPRGSLGLHGSDIMRSTPSSLNERPPDGQVLSSCSTGCVGLNRKHELDRFVSYDSVVQSLKVGEVVQLFRKRGDRPADHWKGVSVDY